MERALMKRERLVCKGVIGLHAMNSDELLRVIHSVCRESFKTAGQKGSPIWHTLRIEVALDPEWIHHEVRLEMEVSEDPDPIRALSLALADAVREEGRRARS